MRPRAATAALVLTAITACTDVRAPGGTPDSAAALEHGTERRDSAGIEIVTSREPGWERDSAWRLAADPEVSLSDTALGLGAIAGLARLAGGAIAVADAEHGTVLVVDREGTVVRRTPERIAGRRFQRLFWIDAAGDTVLAYDLGDHRLVSMPPEGAPTVSELRSVAASSFTPLRPVGRFADGSIAAVSGGSSFPFPGEAYEVRQDSALLLRYAPGGRVRDTLAGVPWGESFGIETGEGRRRMMVPLPRPYGRATSAAVGGDRLFVGTGERFEIAVYDTAGRIVRLVRIPVVADSLPRAAVDSYQARVRRRVAEGDSSAADLALLGALERAPYPERVPAYERLLAAPDGTLWVLDAAPMTRETVTWRVFHSSGRYLGIVPVPARFVVHEVGSDYVLGVWTADGGRREIRLYQIQKPAPPAA